MGLAKFFKNGLNSAANLGNEAYAAPEIFRGGVRDKCSDVWAMGKIIGELCQMARLPTFDLSPLCFPQVLQSSPYYSVVTRMVMMNRGERTTMAGVIYEIRQMNAAAGKPSAALGACGPGAFEEHRLMNTQRPLRPFPPEAHLHETPVLNSLHRPFPQLPALGHVLGPEMATMFPDMHFPSPLVSERRVFHHHQVKITRQVIRNGRVETYEEVKIVK